MPSFPSPHDAACIFCKIVAGQIPCYRLHEDDRVLAFLDIGPLSRGHTLVIPRAHHATLDKMPDDLAGACMAVATRLSRAMVKADLMRDWNILQNNGRAAHQVVEHVHFHIIPKDESAGLGITWPAGKLDGEVAKALIAAIAATL